MPLKSVLLVLLSPPLKFLTVNQRFVFLERERRNKKKDSSGERNRKKTLLKKKSINKSKKMETMSEAGLASQKPNKESKTKTREEGELSSSDDDVLSFFFKP